MTTPNNENSKEPTPTSDKSTGQKAKEGADAAKNGDAYRAPNTSDKAAGTNAKIR
jgi:hypothetical protein